MAAAATSASVSDDGLFVGVDVGTGSVRAGLFDGRGKKIAQEVRVIQSFRGAENEGYAEQSSQDIWLQTCEAVKKVVAGVDARRVKGIGFDATCSLVAVGAEGSSISVSPKTLDPSRNIIMWCCHRAVQEAEEINNRTGATALQYVGGSISPEMQVPKILWLKRHLPEQYQKITKLFDLSDFLVWKATGRDIRSTCNLCCKWLYLCHENRFDEDLYSAIGLDDLLRDKKVGNDFEPVGKSAGTLSKSSALALGLTVEAHVSVGIIDAHAGAIGVLGRASSVISCRHIRHVVMLHGVSY